MRYSYLIEGYRNTEDISLIECFASSKKASFIIANKFLIYYAINKVVISRCAHTVGSRVEIVKVLSNTDYI